MSPTHDAAVSDGRSEADAMGVDAWLTEDQTHVVKIASPRLSRSTGARTVSISAIAGLSDGGADRVRA
jgi:hypothetical protein